MQVSRDARGSERLPAPRTALVTGGASGIGEACVRRLLSAGWCVVIADVNEPAARDRLEQLRDEHGDRVSLAIADVTSEADVAAAIQHADETFGRLDCLVNNAGLGGAFGAVTEILVEDWDFTFSVLVRGVFLGTKHAARLMRRQQRGGAIVNVASIAGLAGGVAPQAYSAAKAAVISFSRNVAVELAPDRIRVNAVCPGIVDTPLVASGKRDLPSALADIQPWPDVACADDVARVIEFLAGEAARFVTGEQITVDGGLLAAGPRIDDRIGGNPALRGLVGVNRGSTGARSTIHAHVD
jgi:NAD(P)-dependent dehydrogenase (short-subunit alcohol dehydrogenase family)